MKNKIFYAVAIAVALFTGYSAYNAHSQQELSDVLLANVEALADNNTEESDQNVTTCPSPYDVRDHMLTYKQRTGEYTTSAECEVSIMGKKFKFADFGGNVRIKITYEIGDCTEPAQGTCYPISLNGDIKIVGTQKL